MSEKISMSNFCSYFGARLAPDIKNNRIPIVFGFTFYNSGFSINSQKSLRR